MRIDSYVADRHRSRKKRRIYFFVFIGLLVVYLILFGIIWFLLRSPIFKVNNIVVQGNQAVSSADVVSLLESSALRDHNLPHAVLGFRNMLTWPNTLSTSTLELIPQLAMVSVSKDYWDHTLTVNVDERTPMGAWCFEKGGESCFWFDKNGVLFERALDTQGNLISVVHDFSQNPRGLNQTVLPDVFTANMISVLNVLQTSGLKVTDITLQDLSLEEVHATTAEGPLLEFSLRFPANNYLSVIKNLMTQSGFSKIQYIDCRTENRVYYK